MRCEHGEEYRHRVVVWGPEEPGEPLPVVQKATFLCPGGKEMHEIDRFFEDLAPAVEERARMMRAVEQYQEYIDGFEEAFPHCDPRVIHSPGACQYCDDEPRLQEYRKMCGLPYTDELHAKDALLPGEDRTRASAEAWGGNQKG